MNKMVYNVGLVGSCKTSKLLAQKFLSEQKNGAPNVCLVASSAGLLTEKQQAEFKGFKECADESQILTAHHVDIVVVTLEGVSKAYEAVSLALENGKHVVTNNATLMSVYGEKLHRIAVDKGVHLRFNAALLGAIPVMDMLFYQFQNTPITRVYGVLSDSSNYILSRMKFTGCTFAEALEDAVELGHAKNTAEVTLSGKEMLYKASLLKLASYGTWEKGVESKESLEQIENVDIQLADKLGYNIKPMAEVTAQSCASFIGLVPEFSKLGEMNGPLSGVVVESKGTGPLFMSSMAQDSEGVATGLYQDCVMITSGLKPWKLKVLPVAKTAKASPQTYYLRVPEHLNEKVRTSPQFYVKEEAKVHSYSALVVETGLAPSAMKDFIKEDEHAENIRIFRLFNFEERT